MAWLIILGLLSFLSALGVLTFFHDSVSPEVWVMGLMAFGLGTLLLSALMAWQWRLVKMLRHADEAPVRPVSSVAVLDVEAEVKLLTARAEGLIQSQRELTRAVAHELRTPVARIRFGIDMTAAAKSDEERAKRLQAMERDITELERLIDEILVYARLDNSAPPLVMQSVCLGTVIEGVVDDARRSAPSKQVVLNTKDEDDIWLQAEPMYLQRALQNVVSNAIKYSRNRVEIHYSRDRVRANVTVDDDGPGIPPDFRDKIFETFVRLDASRSRKTGGHGLGLAIVKRVMDWHRGSVVIDTSPHGGARFLLSFPVG